MKLVKQKIHILKTGRSRAFTLVELMIVMFIFSSIVLIASSSLVSGFLSGNLHSSSSKDINRDVNSLFETIQGKMLTARKASAVLKTGNSMNAGTYIIYGFRQISSDLFVITDSSSECNYVGYYNKTLYMKSQSCLVPSPNIATFTVAERMTSNNLSIEKFIVTSNEYNPANNKTAPYLTLDIQAVDSKTNAEAEFNNTFIIDSLVSTKFQ